MITFINYKMLNLFINYQSQIKASPHYLNYLIDCFNKIICNVIYVIILVICDFYH